MCLILSVCNTAVKLGRQCAIDRSTLIGASHQVTARMSQSQPLVSIVTPVFNGAKYLAECIESVLEQSYDHWDYTIVDNCSTDDTLKIAEQYQKTERRIRLVRNDHFVSAIENHNVAFRQISAESKYCKLLSADDWLYRDCLAYMVDLAERNPDVGVVQSYVINDNGVRWTGLPVNVSVLDGFAAGRLYLLGRVEFAGIPSSNLYRSDLVRSWDPFFPGTDPSADAAACLRCLRQSSFGVVHQILSFERIHDEAITAKVRRLDSYLLDRFELLLRYGPHFLTRCELQDRREEMLRNYYAVMAAALVNMKDSGYWDYHKKRLASLGLPLYGTRLGKALLAKVLDLFLNPKNTIEKVFRRSHEN